LQLIVERACKPGADQIVEMLVLQKFSHALPANVFSNASMKHFNRPIVDLTSNYPDAIAMATGFIA
jgi:hypothetical protein